MEIVSTVADDAGVDVFDLPPLTETIDTEAMQALLAGSDSSVRLYFEYAGRTVVVGADGSVRVRDRKVSP
ncbi:HalOD1 output domain-containing protein [Halosimplex aquaticum]